MRHAYSQLLAHIISFLILHGLGLPLNSVYSFESYYVLGLAHPLCSI